MILGTFRDNEVNDLHPLRVTIQQLHNSAVIINEIRLSPLDIATTKQIVADSFGMSVEDAAELGVIVHKKTNGNPSYKSFSQIIV